MHINKNIHQTWSLLWGPRIVMGHQSEQLRIKVKMLKCLHIMNNTNIGIFEIYLLKFLCKIQLYNVALPYLRKPCEKYYGNRTGRLTDRCREKLIIIAHLSN